MPKNYPEVGEIWWRGEERVAVESVHDGLVSFGDVTMSYSDGIYTFSLNMDPEAEHHTLPLGDFLESCEPPCTFVPNSSFPYREGTCAACGTESVEVTFYTYNQEEDGITDYFICERCWTTVPGRDLVSMIKAQVQVQREKSRPTLWDRLSG